MSQFNTPWYTFPTKASSVATVFDSDGKVVFFSAPELAERTVLCVNSHAALVDALQWLEKIAGTAPLHDDPARVSARAALAAAGVKQ